MTVRILTTPRSCSSWSGGEDGDVEAYVAEVGTRRLSFARSSFLEPRHAWLDHFGTGEERPHTAPRSHPDHSGRLLVPVRGFLELGMGFRRSTAPQA